MGGVVLPAGRLGLGHEVAPDPVVYVAGEGQQGLGRRFGAWKIFNDVNLDGKPFYVAPAVAMTDVSQREKLTEAINSEVGRPSLIVLDTLARNFGGGDGKFHPGYEPLRGRL